MRLALIVGIAALASRLWGQAAPVARHVSVRASTATTEPIVAGDMGKEVTLCNAAGVAATLPNANTLISGWYVQVKNICAGDAVITPTGTISGVAAITLSLGESAFIVGDGTNYEANSTRVTISTGVTKSASRTAVQIGLDTAVVPFKSSANTFAELQTLEKGANISSSTALAAAGDVRYNGGTIQYHNGSAPQTLLINPFTTRGDFVLQGASGPTRLAAGASGTFLMGTGAASDPAYQTPNASQITNAFDKSTNNDVGAFYIDIGEQSAPSAPSANVARLYAKDDGGATKLCYKDSAASELCIGTGAGTVTSVGQTFTGGLISVAGSPITGSGTLALTVAGTSGGIPYFSSGTAWASSGALTNNAIVFGGGAGASPKVDTVICGDVSNHRLGIGTCSPVLPLHVLVSGGAIAAALYNSGDSALIQADTSSAGMRLVTASATAGVGSNILLTRAKGSPSSPTTVASGDTIGTTFFQAYDGTSRINAASFGSVIDNTVSTGTAPGALFFSTSLTSTPIERIRISSTGQVNIGQTASTDVVTNVDLGIFDETATTGVTKVVVQMGQGQSTTAPFEIFDYNATLGGGTLLYSISSAGVVTMTTAPILAITGIVKGNGSSAAAAATAGTDYTSPSSSETFTNKTYDTAATGNVFTALDTPRYITAAGCNNATATGALDLPTTNAATTLCIGTTTTTGFLVFADGSTQVATFHHRLPTGWTSTGFTVNLIYSGSVSSTSTIDWRVSTACVADNEDPTSPSYNATSTNSAAGPTTTPQIKTSTFTPAVTNCAATEMQYIKVEKVTGDSYTGSGYLQALEIVQTRAQ